jgi:PPOX class probable F420-dependent enzyme
MPIPPVIQGQKYISLTSFRKSGAAVATPVRFGEQDDKLYAMTRSDSGKYKRIRNNPQVRVAP